MIDESFARAYHCLLPPLSPVKRKPPSWGNDTLSDLSPTPGKCDPIWLVTTHRCNTPTGNVTPPPYIISAPPLLSPPHWITTPPPPYMYAWHQMRIAMRFVARIFCALEPLQQEKKSALTCHPSSSGPPSPPYSCARLWRQRTTLAFVAKSLVCFLFLSSCKKYIHYLGFHIQPHQCADEHLVTPCPFLLHLTSMFMYREITRAWPKYEL